MTWVRGMPLPTAHNKEAAPVVTGAIDNRTAGHVFRGWASCEYLQERFNPWLELDKARDLRDESARVWAVETHQLAGTPQGERIRFAQDYLIMGLAERGWTRAMIEAYLDVDLAHDDWRILL